MSTEIINYLIKSKYLYFPLFYLFQFDEQVFNKLKVEIDELVKNAESTHMKEIKGLGERLFGLDQLMRDAKKVVQQQGDIAQAFLNVSNIFLNL